MAAKLKRAHQDAVPYKLVIGEKEIGNDYAEARAAVKKLVAAVKGMPFIRREWPAELSKQL